MEKAYQLYLESIKERMARRHMKRKFIMLNGLKQKHHPVIKIMIFIGNIILMDMIFSKIDVKTYRANQNTRN